MTRETIDVCFVLTGKGISCAALMIKLNLGVKLTPTERIMTALTTIEVGHDALPVKLTVALITLGRCV